MATLASALNLVAMVGCSLYPMVLSFGSCFPAFPEAQATCRAKMYHGEGCWCNGQVCFLFPSPSGDTLHTISVISTSVLNPDTWTRLVDDLAKAMLGVQDAKEIVPSPAQVTATFLGITTAWWKQGLFFQLVSPGFGCSCFKMAQNLLRSRARQRPFRRTGKRSFYAAWTRLGL